ncbi:sulfatase-like hydrolase/transferase [bacterium]|nr:sulfatase-like hydrolase/transferase [bacterium]
MRNMASRPNILFICTDQQRFDSLGCYGNVHVQTPTIDKLAEDGVLFEQCYVQSPVCSPSRASLLTGQYVHAHGLWANGVALPDHAQIFSKALADDGYDCGLIGKWHQAACFQGRTEPRRDDGFRFFQWAHDPTHGSPENQYHRWLETEHPELYAEAIRHGTGRQGHKTVPFDTMPTEAHYSHWVAEKSIEFLEDERNDDTPFFLWVNFFDPHHPFIAPQEYLDRYDPSMLPAPVGYPGELESKPEIQRQASQKSYGGHASGFTEHAAAEIQEIIAAYYAMMSLIDDEVARILARLQALGLDENTLVIFTSDHGEMLGDHQLLLKGPMLYEAAVRVPLILRWPGHLPAGERRDDLVQWIDLNPTMLDAAGVDPLPGNQAQSLLPLARGDEDASSRGWALCEYRDSGHPYQPPVHTTMLRTGQYKLIVNHGAPATARPREGELYDLAADPNELRNLWADPAHREVRTELQEMLLDVLVATEDRGQVREAYW